jgi:hypothetical protein
MPEVDRVVVEEDPEHPSAIGALAPAHDLPFESDRRVPAVDQLEEAGPVGKRVVPRQITHGPPVDDDLDRVWVMLIARLRNQ